MSTSSCIICTGKDDYRSSNHGMWTKQFDKLIFNFYAGNTVFIGLDIAQIAHHAQTWIIGGSSVCLALKMNTKQIICQQHTEENGFWTIHRLHPSLRTKRIEDGPTRVASIAKIPKDTDGNSMFLTSCQTANLAFDACGTILCCLGELESSRNSGTSLRLKYTHTRCHGQHCLLLQLIASFVVVPHPESRTRTLIPRLIGRAGTNVRSAERSGHHTATAFLIRPGWSLQQRYCKTRY